MIIYSLVSQSGITISPKVIHGVDRPWAVYPDETTAVPFRVDTSGSQFVTFASGGDDPAQNASSFDMFKYQVGVDRGSYEIAAGDTAITLSSDFNNFRRDQFPKYIYDINQNSFHIINGFTGSVSIGSVVRSRIDLADSITSATSESLIIKYNDVENAYDTNLNSELNIVQNPPWIRYTDPESIGTGSSIASGAFIDWGNEIDMRGYNTLTVFCELLIANSTDVGVRALGKHASAGANEYNQIIKTVGSSDVKVEDHYYEFNDDSNQFMILDFEIGNGIPYIQLQHRARTTDAGNASGSLTASFVKSWN